MYRELKNTVELMTSSDYKDRFKAEYYQVKIRKNKLKKMLNKYYDGTLEFEPTCPIKVLQAQLSSMIEYCDILETRARLEGIEL